MEGFHGQKYCNKVLKGRHLLWRKPDCGYLLTGFTILFLENAFLKFNITNSSKANSTIKENIFYSDIKNVINERLILII